MVLEASVLLIDNSEWMRNGDYTPSRFQARPKSDAGSLDCLGNLTAPRAEPDRPSPSHQAQIDAVNLLAGAKTQSNPENCVGVLSLAGNVPKMLVTPTPELGKILNCLHVVQIDGAIHFGTGVQARSHGRADVVLEASKLAVRG